MSGDAGPDPKTRLKIAEAVDNMLLSVEEKDLEEAIKILNEIAGATKQLFDGIYGIYYSSLTAKPAGDNSSFSEEELKALREKSRLMAQEALRKIIKEMSKLKPA